MALSASSMKSRVEAYMTAAGPVQTSDPAAAAGHRDAMLLAMCQGIVDEITSNAAVHTTDSRGDTCNNGTVT